VEPLLRVAHKYSLRVPLEAAQAFLEHLYGPSLLESALVGEQPLHLSQVSLPDLDPATGRPWHLRSPAPTAAAGASKRRVGRAAPERRAC
jgi:hypothetical protein